ncbi:type IV pilus modification PilV family protein [Rheinheimera oceanensis]|uniref:type IV pilus modification PilV family protein n=1 Tax=Rheinheimera oceanensis TaxID=2817449 RepID=UPI001BFD124A|nr:prepilin-type N-terminal cleavage/methylation domain-containing protein [Rheinheimera oceanensis]
MLKPSLKYSRGVTLIELIVGIVVLAISLSIITSVLGPLFIKSADPWHQVRAAELGHSLMNEILGKSFDENSSRSGSLVRCGESGISCLLGREEADRTLYDDVDDFNGMGITGDLVLRNILNESIAARYRSYRVEVAVAYAADDFTPALPANTVKKITITVIPPSGGDIRFVAYKGNW